MSWNYRIVKYHDGSGYGIHEVYYGDDGQLVSRTEEPIGDVHSSAFLCKEDLLDVLMKLEDYPEPLDEPETWPGFAKKDKT
jgi:hypothetical protein